MSKLLTSKDIQKHEHKEKDTIMEVTKLVDLVQSEKHVALYTPI
jgi:hypothetical protein